MRLIMPALMHRGERIAVIYKSGKIVFTSPLLNVVEHIFKITCIIFPLSYSNFQYCLAFLIRSNNTSI